MTDRHSRRRALHEAAHKGDVAVEPDDKPGSASPAPQKRIFHEAAHKLGYWGPSTPKPDFRS
jgi:hypothetical protein